MLAVVLISGTSYRLTRLLTRDDFPPIALARARVSERYGDQSWPAYLASCSWCMGVWVSGAVTLATWLSTRRRGVPLPALTWGTAAAVTGFVASKEG